MAAGHRGVQSLRREVTAPERREGPSERRTDPIAAAGLAGLVDFSPAVAAFLVGLLLTGEVAEVARRRLDPLRDVLAAVFFAYFGLAVNPEFLREGNSVRDFFDPPKPVIGQVDDAIGAVRGLVALA